MRESNRKICQESEFGLEFVYIFHVVKKCCFQIYIFFRLLTVKPYYKIFGM